MSNVSVVCKFVPAVSWFSSASTPGSAYVSKSIVSDKDGAVALSYASLAATANWIVGKGKSFIVGAGSTSWFKP